jgi:hypothetical protein
VGAVLVTEIDASSMNTGDHLSAFCCWFPSL